MSIGMIDKHETDKKEIGEEKFGSCSYFHFLVRFVRGDGDERCSRAVRHDHATPRSAMHCHAQSRTAAPRHALPCHDYAALHSATHRHAALRRVTPRCATPRRATPRRSSAAPEEHNIGLSAAFKMRHQKHRKAQRPKFL